MKRIGALLLLLALLLGLMGGPHTALAQEKISRLGEYAGYSAPLYQAWTHFSMYARTRDGTGLAVDIFRPARDGKAVDQPLPVIWTFARCGRANVLEGKLTTMLDMMPWLQTVLQHGYVVAAADLRGSGASFGTRQGEFTPQDGLDAYDLTEWFAAQPWCDGQVGMFGGLDLDASPFLAAAQAPPHLKAVLSYMAPFDLYAMAYTGGIFRNDLAVGWSTRIGRLDRGREAALVDIDSGGMIMQAVAQHQGNLNVLSVFSALPFRDGTYLPTGAQPYLQWGPSNYRAAISASGVPIYHMAGWFDPFVRDDLLAFTGLHNPQKLTIGPWSHASYQGLDMAAEYLRWFDYWLKGIDNGVLQESPIHYYAMGAAPGQEWRAAEAWPPADQKPTPFYLAAGPSGSVVSVNDGLLKLQADGEVDGQDAYTVDYTTTSGHGTRWTSAYGGPFNYRDMTVNDRKGLTYSSAPLTRDLEVTGHPTLHLWMSCTAPDVDVFVYLEEVELDGSSTYITEGALRASQRATATPPYDYLGLPYRAYAEAEDLPVGEPVELIFDLLPTSNVFEAGNRMRLTITGADSDNAMTPVQSPPPVVSIYRNAAHGSYLLLPLSAAPTPPVVTVAPTPSAPQPTPVPLSASLDVGDEPNVWAVASALGSGVLLIVGMWFIFRIWRPKK